jgi:exosortase/archaeosortase family protein
LEPDPEKIAEASQREWIRPALVWICTAFLFAPAIEWLATRTFGSEQLKQAFLILVFAAVYLLRQRRLSPQWDLEGPSRRDLLIAYAFMGAAIVLKQPLLALAACCFALSGLLLFIWGSSIQRFTYALLVTFAGFVALTLGINRADWPLRFFAGFISSFLLGWTGTDNALLLVVGPPSRLLITTGGHNFEVAPECNGFGVLSSCALFALLLVLQARGRWVSKILKIISALLVALSVNVLRILSITLLAPLVGEHYMEMHETMGYVALGAALGIVWWICGPRPGDLEPPPEETVKT